MLTECKETAAKKRRQSTRLENLGIPEEELLRQQQELFARARESQLQQERLQQERSDGAGGGNNVTTGGTGTEGADEVAPGHDQDTGSEEEEEDS